MTVKTIHFFSTLDSIDEEIFRNLFIIRISFQIVRQLKNYFFFQNFRSDKFKTDKEIIWHLFIRAAFNFELRHNYLDIISRTLRVFKCFIFATYKTENFFGNFFLRMIKESIQKIFVLKYWQQKQKYLGTMRSLN